MTEQTISDLRSRYDELVEDEKFSYKTALGKLTRGGGLGPAWEGYIAARAAREEFEHIMITIGLSDLIAIVGEEE